MSIGEVSNGRLASMRSRPARIARGSGGCDSARRTGMAAPHFRYPAYTLRSCNTINFLYSVDYPQGFNAQARCGFPC